MFVSKREMPLRQLSRCLNILILKKCFEENINNHVQALSCKTIAVFGATGEVTFIWTHSSYVSLLESTYIFNQVVLDWNVSTKLWRMATK